MTAMVSSADPVDLETDKTVAELHVVNRKLYEGGLEIEQLAGLILLPGQLSADGTA